MLRLRILLLAVTVMCVTELASQAQGTTSVHKFTDLDFGAGNTEGTLVVSLNIDKGLGQKRKIIIGFGGRFNAYLGKNQYFVTAPAKLTSGSTGPGVIFKENIEANMDTFLVKSAQLNSLNLFLTLGYNLSERLMVRFNIDLIGFSFGKSVTGNYINGTQGKMEGASPTSFNLLLISDNDRGSLNSQFFARYLLNEKWGIKGGIQFLFSEYTTDTEVQQFPEPNDRFRNKSLLFSAGVSFKL